MINKLGDLVFHELIKHKIQNLKFRIHTQFQLNYTTFVVNRVFLASLVSSTSLRYLLAATDHQVVLAIRGQVHHLHLDLLLCVGHNKHNISVPSRVRIN